MTYSSNKTKFYVIAAVIRDGDSTAIKYWKATHSSGTWVDDIAKAKHYSTLGGVKYVFKTAYHGYLGNWGMDALLATYSNVEFKVMEATAIVELKEVV